MLIFLFRVFVATFVNEVSHHVAFAHVCASLVVSFGCWVMLVGGTFTYLGVLSRSREVTLTCHVRPAFLPASRVHLRAADFSPSLPSPR